MKKRDAITATTAFLLMFILSACASAGSSDKQGSTNGQAYQRPDLMGQVTAIAGNEVTLNVIELPQMPAGSAGQRPTAAGNNPAATLGGNQPAASSETSPGSSTQKQRGYTFTGEEKTIMIPVGVSITAVQRSGAVNANPQATGNNSVQTVAMDFKDIQAGDILSIWYSEKDSTAISKVIIASSSSTAGQEGGFPGGDFPGGGPGGEPPAGRPEGN